jgi:transcriptional regulator with XRE-family HTH domain
MEEIGNNLKYLREKILDLSQEDFSKEVGGFSQMSLSHWESGDRKPKKENVDKIIEYCHKKGIRVNQDLSIKTGPDIPAESDTGLTATLQRLADFYKKRADHYEKLLIERGISLD